MAPMRAMVWPTASRPRSSPSTLMPGLPWRVWLVLAASTLLHRGHSQPPGAPAVPTTSPTTTTSTLDVPPGVPTTVTTTSTTMVELDKAVDLSVDIDTWGAKAPSNCSNCTQASPSIAFCTIKGRGGHNVYSGDNANNSVSGQRSTKLISAYKLFFQYLETQGGIVIYGVRHFPKLIVVNSSESLNEINFWTTLLAESFGCEFFLAPAFEEGAVTMAKMVQQLGKVMVSPVGWSSSLFSGLSNTFGVHPPPRQILKNALRQAEMAGGVVTVAYHWEDNPYSQQVCHEVEERHALQGTGQGQSIVLKRSWQTIDELKNITHEMAGLAPDLVVFCIYDTSKCSVVIQYMLDHDINPNSIVASGCLVSDEYLKETGFHGRFIVGADVYSRSLSATSNLTFPGLTNAQFNDIWHKADPDSNPSVEAALAWASLDLLVWAILQAQTHLAYGVIQKLGTASGSSSITGTLELGSDGQQQAEALAVQWHQQTGRPENQHVWSVSEIEVIIGPEKHKNQFGWFPKPSWDHLTCWRSDIVGGEFGFPHLNDPNVKCQRCPDTQLSSAITAIHPAHEEFGEITLRLCTDCPLGKIVQHINPLGGLAAERSCKNCSQGRFAVRDSLQCSECPTGSYQPEEGGTSCLACPLGKHQDRAGETLCHACKPPFVATIVGSSHCTLCPEGGRCLPNTEGLYTNYTNEDGYYLMTEEQFDHETWVKEDIAATYPLGKPLQCSFLEDVGVCRSGTWNNITTQLSNQCLSDGSYTSSYGPMCGSCAKGYEKTKSLENCKKCPPIGVVVLYCGIHAAGMAALALVAFADILFTDEKGVKRVYSILVKQLLNYSGMMHAIRPFVTFFFADGTTMWDYLYWTHIMGSTSPSVIETSTHCLLHEWFPDLEPVYSSVVMAFTMIPLWILVDMMIFIAIKLCCCCCNRSQRQVFQCVPRFHLRKAMTKDALLSLMVIQIHVNIVRVTGMLVAPFECLVYDTNRFLYNQSIKCSDSEHVKWQVVAMVGVIVISCGAPAVLYLFLRSLKSKGTLYHPHSVRRYGYFHIGFEHDKWYFEFVLMLRRVLFLVLPLLPFFAAKSIEHRHIAGQSILLVLSVAFMYIHFTSRPYDHRSFFLHGRIESAMLMAVFLTLASQALITSTRHSDVFVDDEGIVAKDRQEIRDSSCFYIVMASHLYFLCLVLWGIFRPLVHNTKVFDKLHMMSHMLGVRQFTFIKGGIKTTVGSSDAENILAEVCTSLASTYISYADVFEYAKFTKLLQSVFADAGYWTSLEEAHGVVHAMSQHRFRSALLEQDSRDLSTDRITRIAKSLCETVRDGDVMFMLQALDGGIPEDERQLNRVLNDMRKEAQRQMTNFKNYQDSLVSSEALYLSYLRCYADIFDSIEATQTGRSMTAGRSQMGMQQSVRFTFSRDSDSSQPKNKKWSDMKGQKSMITNAMRYGNKFNLSAFRGNFKEKIQPEDPPEVEQLIGTNNKDVKQVRIGGVPLAMERVLASHHRDLTRKLTVMERENERISRELAQFFKQPHLPGMKEMLEETAMLDNYLEVTIKQGHFVRDPELMIEAARERPDVRSFRTLVTCSLVDRSLVESTARFSAAAASEGCHPQWAHTGKLFGYFGDDVIEIQLRSLQIDAREDLTDEERIQSRYELMSSVKIDSKMFIPNGFSGEVQLKRDSIFFRGAEIGHTSLEIVIKLVDPSGSASKASSRRPTAASLFENETSFRSVARTLASTNFQDGLGSRSFGLSSTRMTGKPTDARTVIDAIPEDEPSEEEKSVEEEEEPGLEIRDALKNLEDITEDAGADCTIDEAMDAEDRAQESNQILGGYVNVLRNEILEMEKEIRDFQEEDILHGKELQVLSSTSNFVGSPGPHLKVGKSIFGAAALAKANAKLPRGQSIAVQTEESQDAEAATEFANTLRAEALSLKFKLKEFEIKNEAVQRELQVISEELGEVPTTTSV